MLTEPPLHRAARFGDHEAIRTLVALGVDINALFGYPHDSDFKPDDEDWFVHATPLMVAAGSNEGATEETLALLLELGADPTFTEEENSAVSWSLIGDDVAGLPGGSVDRTKLILEAGAKFPDRPTEPNRLFCWTAGTGDEAKLRLLLEHGFHANGFWDADSAVHNYRKMTLGLESEGVPSRGAGKREADFESMISKPSSYDIPLFRAAESGNAGCVKLLLAAGASPLVRNRSGRTAIYMARTAEVLKILMEEGLALEDPDGYGGSPLFGAVAGGPESLGAVQTLVEAGANVNATYDRGYTVFMSAVGSFRYPALLRYLVSKGADPHAVSELGYNAFHAAIDVDFGANAEESVRDTLGYLRDLGVDLEHRTRRGHTPLAIAIERGTALEVQVLCELGADVNACCPIVSCGPESCSRVDYPLLFHVVIGSGVNQGAKAEALLQAGANPLTTDAEGHLPVAHAVASLCSKAEERDSLFRQFFIARGRIPFDENGFPNTQSEFLNHVRPLVASFVEGFAAQIPMRRNRKFDKEIRKERIECIVSLCAYEAWFRHVGQ